MQISDVLAGLTALGGERTEMGFLDRLCTLAAELCGADFCASLLLGSYGEPSALAHVGMTDAEVAVLPHLPRPVGLIGLVLEGTTLRLEDMRTHPRAVGFPSAHVAMGPMLGVPVRVHDEVIGAVYLTRRAGGAPFTPDELGLTEALSVQVAQLVLSLRRLEAADALVQRLSRASDNGDRSRACGNSGAVRRLVAEARRTVGAEVAILSRISDGEELLVCVDAGPQAPAFQEGTAFGVEEGYCTLTLEGRIPASVPELASHPITSTMPVTSAMDLGSYCGTPVHLPDGTVYGVLCGLSSQSGIHVSGAQLESLRVIADDLIATDLATTRESEESWLRDRAAFTRLMSPDQRSVHLQPIVELATHRVVGFEALSRFYSVDGIVTTPDEVFARAARYGLGVRLEQEAAQGALSLLSRVPAPSYLSINFSPTALRDPTTVELLIAAGVDADRIVIELTEHEQVDDYDELLTVLGRLRQQGIRLAIDDTGAGYASLQHVSRMHPDIIKLDAVFVRGVHRDPGRRAVARALTAFSADVGASLIAEGVETPDEARELASLGVVLGQGFLFGRPAPAADVLAGVDPTATTRP